MSLAFPTMRPRGSATARFQPARLLIMSLRSMGAGISLIEGTFQLMRFGMSLSQRDLMCSAWRVQTPAMLSVASARYPVVRRCGCPHFRRFKETGLVAKLPRSDDVAGVFIGQDGDIIEERPTDLCFSTRSTAMAPSQPARWGPAPDHGSTRRHTALMTHGSRTPAGAITRVARRRRT
jgi:hypothetical protein